MIKSTSILDGTRDTGFEDFFVGQVRVLGEKAVELIAALNPKAGLSVGNVCAVIENAACAIPGACFPYYGENETPCYLEGTCKNERCLYKEKQNENSFTV